MHQTIIHSLNYHISVPPKIVPFGSGDDDQPNFGDAVQLTCLVATGDPPLQLTWSFHGAADSSKKNQEGVSFMKVGTKSSLLIIESLQAHHSGNYTCSAKNSAGTDEYTTSIVVNGIIFCNLKRIVRCAG